MNHDKPDSMDLISEAVSKALNEKFPHGVDLGTVAATLASMSVFYMSQYHNLSCDEAKGLVINFIEKAPIGED